MGLMSAAKTMTTSRSYARLAACRQQSTSILGTKHYALYLGTVWEACAMPYVRPFAEARDNEAMSSHCPANPS